MLLNEGNLQSLTGGLRLKVRIQHPEVHERTDRGGSYWYFRYWDDVLQADGTMKPVRRFHVVGPSKGETRLSKKQAEVERDKFLATINKPSIQEKVADGLALFSKPFRNSAASSTSPMTGTQRPRASTSGPRSAGTSGESTMRSADSKTSAVCWAKGMLSSLTPGRASSAFRSVARTLAPSRPSNAAEAIPDFFMPTTSACIPLSFIAVSA